MTEQKAPSPSYRFARPEVISDLRTQKEIALMNGREWTRALPPRPVLPPYGRLEKVSGRLESFSSECFSEYFGVQAYRNNTLPRISDAQRGAGAAEAVLAGSPAAGGLLVSSTITRSQKEYAEYVQGSINGRPFRGWVGMTRLQAGDSVEMAAEWRDDHYEVYAIALPQERIVSVCPGCDRGHIAEGWLRVRNMLILTAVIVFGMSAVFVIGYLNGDISTLKYIISSGWMFLFISMFISGLIALSAYKAYVPTTCRLAEEIFTLFGRHDVERVNLKKFTSRRERELKKTGQWHSPDDKEQIPVPSQKFIYSDENWFYY
ncbi:putative type VI secretion system effector [Erwinia sp. V90_4]|uniref:putative type VI secretion system effector n=1 Tax=Erwinia sp. V90_4 TaxID=3044239 RepID=UPI00249EFC03|nr:putative type VI secretion system effector [Erwinia sp. V90_4]MDI3439020.1 putative type VI secretion system effector [Erwinia sp. V90_4]